MQKLNKVTFPRRLTPKGAHGSPVLCVFSDSSEDAFGACAYVRWQVSNTEFETCFVAAKSRVAPLKLLTIPRLELQAAVLASRLYNAIKNESRLSFDHVVFFTDSMIVFSWIRSQARRFKAFVSIRVAEIQANTDPSQWRHLPGELNVSDEVSRGIKPHELTGRWQQGPNFLHQPEELWPKTKMNEEKVNSEVNKELRKVQVCNVAATSQRDLIDYERFSSWRKLIRVTAHVLKFISSLKARRQKREESSTLTPKEITKGEVHLNNLHIKFGFLDWP